MRRLFLFTILLSHFLIRAAAAQPADTVTAVRPGTMFGQVSGNFTTFLDDGPIDHVGVGSALRVYLTPRLSIGPELVYLIGPGNDRDVLLFASLTVDLKRPMLGQVGRVEPYLVAGAGLLSHSDSYNSYTSSNVSRAFSWGGGARVWVARRVYIASDVRLGWTPNIRVTGTVGVIGR
jgi:hypothetical protein